MLQGICSDFLEKKKDVAADKKARDLRDSTQMLSILIRDLRQEARRDAVQHQIDE